MMASVMSGRESHNLPVKVFIYTDYAEIILLFTSLPKDLPSLGRHPRSSALRALLTIQSSFTLHCLYSY
jgi:hypothetical protein